MNTKYFFYFSILIFLSLTLFSCSSENRFVLCKVSEYDCDYQHKVPGIITVTKGSSRLHYVLTENGMKKAEIKEGEPVAYNPETETAAVKEVTDSSIDIFTVDIRSGRELSPAISLKPKMKGRDGRPVFAVPTLLGSCVLNDGSLILLVNYENPEFAGLDTGSESYDFLFVYEKGDPKKLKKYVFPYDEESENETDETNDEFFWDEPQNILCSGKNIYLFSERHYHNNQILSLLYNRYPNRILSRIDTDPQKEKAEITDFAIIAFDDITFSYYSEKDNRIYTSVRASGSDKAILRPIGLDEGYELPEPPVERENGEFLFSETPVGKPLIFFVKTRSHLEEQRIELLPF